MRLDELLDDAASVMPVINNTLKDMNISCTGLTDDSRRFKPGNIFVCVKGKTDDGHRYAAEMLAFGAACVVTERDLNLEGQVIVRDSRKFFGLLCAAWFNHPERKMKLIGITGTNGKTTLAAIINDILTKCGHRTGMIGTTGVLINGKQMNLNGQTFTTPPVYELYEIWDKMAKEACDAAVMEVSSFALAQNRIGPAKFQCGVFTNLTQDHFEYHSGMEDYYNAKKILFTEHCETAFINIDDGYGRKLFSEIGCRKYSFSLKGNADLYATAIKAADNKTKFWVTADSKGYPVTVNMFGRYNVSNAVAAIAVCSRLGLNINRILSCLGEFKGVKGRCEIISEGRGFKVMCDYAHTPDALKNLLKSMREYTQGRIICVFGAGGNRDKSKRPQMGAAAEKYADFLIITSDNPRDEEPGGIINGIIAGLSFTKPYMRITDRKAAIKRALAIAEPGDLVILAGKGHETYQVLKNNVHISFDEREIVRETMALYKKPRFNSGLKVSVSLDDIIAAAGGSINSLSIFGKSIYASDIFSDTRDAKKGGLFIALKGENFDGHDFVGEAISQGAAAAITERVILDCPCIVVKDTKKALMDLARFFRMKYNLTMVGVTGSVGKTSTKEMLALALSAEHTVYKTRGNRNNEIGVPFALLGLNETCTAAVIELGMSGFGEIERLSKAVRPNICVITNIGYAHIEKLGSQEGILEAKLEILKGALPSAPLIINGDDRLLMSVKEEYGNYREIITYGIENEDADYRAVNIEKYDEHMSFGIMHDDEIICNVSLYCKGNHNILNAAAAIAAACSAGCNPVTAAEMLSVYQPYSMRQDIRHMGKHTVILDCYNASPASMEASLDILAEMKPKNGGRRVAVLGDMLELGELSAELHERIGEYAFKKGIDLLYCYGENAVHIAKRANELGMHAGSSADKRMLLNFMKYKLKENDIILFKASRGIRLEEIVEEYYSGIRNEE